MPPKDFLEKDERLVITPPDDDGVDERGINVVDAIRPRRVARYRVEYAPLPEHPRDEGKNKRRRTEPTTNRPLGPMASAASRWRRIQVNPRPSRGRGADPASPGRGRGGGRGGDPASPGSGRGGGRGGDPASPGRGRGRGPDPGPAGPITSPKRTPKTPKETPYDKLRFHYVSDLHCEQKTSEYREFDFNPTGQYMIFAGDIGNLQATHRDHLEYLLRRFCEKPELKRVFYITGNREYHDIRSIDEGIGFVKGWEKKPRMKGKLSCLENDRVDIEDGGGKVVVLGATMWSKVQPSSYREELMTGRERCQRHNDSVQFFRNEVKKIRGDPKEKDTRILIITHHPPSLSGTSRPNQTGSGPNDEGSKYGTNLIDGVRHPDGLYDHSRIKTTFPLLGEKDVWVYGHTHFMAKFGQVRKNGLRFISNQRGNFNAADEQYNVERGHSFPFQADKTFEI